MRQMQRMQVGLALAGALYCLTSAAGMQAQSHRGAPPHRTALPGPGLLVASSTVERRVSLASEPTHPVAKPGVLPEPVAKVVVRAFAAGTQAGRTIELSPRANKPYDELQRAIREALAHPAPHGRSGPLAGAVLFLRPDGMVQHGYLLTKGRLVFDLETRRCYAGDGVFAWLQRCLARG